MSTRICWPAVNPLTLASFTFVSPAAAGTTSVVTAPPAVPTDVILAVSGVPPVSTEIVSPTAKLVTDATFTFVSPAAAGAISVVLPPVTVTGVMLCGWISEWTVTGGRGLATSGVVSYG